jgi:transcriptional regulator with XRE-family HTH domain
MKNNPSTQGQNEPQGQKTTIIEDFMRTISPEAKRAVRKKMEVAVHIAEAIRARGWSQKEFAQRLGKRESEISKWLSGKQNFTLESLCMIEETLGCEIFEVPTASQGVSQRMLESLATMQREAGLWNVPLSFGRFSTKTVSQHAISMDHFSLQPLSSYERSTK